MTQAQSIRRTGRRVGRVDIVILVACFGVLAAVAVPRQLRLGDDLRRGDVASLERSVSSAVQLAHAVWQASDRPGVLELPGAGVVMVHGYPSAGTVSQLLEDSETAAFRFSAGRWQHRELPTRRDCGLVYRPPTDQGSRPRISVNTQGC